jgi:Xaa-Pro aminopeptidase
LWKSISLLVAGVEKISIRVEDMVHVRENDQVILSCNTPKEVADVEACGCGLLDGIR